MNIYLVNKMYYTPTHIEYKYIPLCQKNAYTDQNVNFVHCTYLKLFLAYASIVCTAMYRNTYLVICM